MRRTLLTLFIAISSLLSARAQPWTLIPNDLVMTYLGSVSIADASTVYVTGNYAWADSSSFLKSTDGGLSFHHISTSFLPPGHTAHKVCFLNADTGYVVSFSTFGSSPTSDGTIHRTTDGGTSWIPVISGISQMIVELKFADANTGYAVATNNSRSPYSLYRTTNGGLSWSWFYTSPPGMGYSDLIIVDANTVFITGDNADYQASITRISAGVVGSTTAFPAYNSFKIGQFTSTTEGVVVGLIAGATPAHHLLKTSDGGLTWTPTYITDIKSLNAIGLDADGTGFLVGARKMTTPDYGVSWSTLYDTAFYGYGELYDIDIKDGLRIIVGQSGGIWRQVSTTGSTQHSVKSALNAFPNPASQTIEIDFSRSLKGTLNVYDITGRLMQTMEINGLHATVNVENLVNGLYRVDVCSDGTTISKLITLQHKS